MDDNEIRAALRRGQDEVAFRLLRDAYGPAVYSTCCRILRNSAAAEDAMQLAMISALKSRDQLLEVDQIRGWLIKVAINKCRDALRIAKRRNQLQPHLVDGDGPDEASVLDQLGTTQARRALEECLAALAAQAPETVAVIQMRYREDMTWAEIAEAIGTPLDTIRMRVKRAFKSLRACLAAKEVTP